jgi:threonine/homoserine/homoserine lactone efflux protein
MSTSLAIFLAIATTGCAFLIYFLYALWRDAGSSKHRGRVHITTLPVVSAHKGKLLRLYSTEQFAREKRAARNSQ